MLRPNCTLHFEVDDLCNASPATVSRAGIIYVSHVDLGWQPYYVSWLKEIKRPKAEDELLSKRFDKVVKAIFELLLFECSPCMYKTPIMLLTSMCTILYQLLLDAGKENAKLDLAQVERYCIFNLRDLSRIFQGVFMCDSDAGMCAKYGYTLKTDIMLLGLWKHECERVFADRLVDSLDKGRFVKTINKLL
jgi:hypothetical protein